MSSSYLGTVQQPENEVSPVRVERRFHPVVISGGVGSRLWPLSRASYPKQLLPLVGDQSLLQATLVRAAALPGACSPIVVCNHEHRFLIAEQCQQAGVLPGGIVLEPEGRNTAPAVALAALQLAATDSGTLMLVLPSDHVIQDQAAFAQAVKAALEAAQAGYVVTFGIEPTAPETGYGYILQGTPLSGQPGVHSVDRFIEKPDTDTARQFLQTGGYSWNSGMFVVQAGIYLAELAQHRPDIHAAATSAWQARTQDLDFCRPGHAEFLACPSDSIDYAVMQRTEKAAVVPASIGWSDLGAWDALWSILPKTTEGNALQGDVIALNTRNSLVRADSRLVAVLGLDNVTVVETADAVLVMATDQAQHVKKVVDALQASTRREHLDHIRMYRPWGWYEGIDAGDRFQVKRLMVKPGCQLSLQMHHHRAEHWVVVSGTAKVTVGDTTTLLAENQSTYIPLGHTHRLENPGKVPLHIIEVQSGSYLGEDDIVRFEDIYGR